MGIRKISTHLAVSIVWCVSQTALANPDSDMCTVTRTKGTRSELAVGLITRACRKVYENNNFLLQNERNYYGCLLQHLPGTDNDTAAQQIARICGR
jgi:hypothetical protein